MNKMNLALQNELLGFFGKSKQAKAFLSFIREHNLKDKLLSETSWFLLANIIFSASTYVVGFLIPYILDTNYMAFFSSGNQILVVLSMVFEFGISLSFLRFYQLEKSSKYIFSILQLCLLAFLIVIALFFSKYVNQLFNIDDLPVNEKLFYLIIIGQYGWGYIKTWLLATNEIKKMTVHAIIIFVLRVVFLVHLYLIREFSVTQMLLETLLYPFIPSLLHQSYLTGKALLESLVLIKKKEFMTVKEFFNKVYDFLQFSILTYLANFFFLYTGRYLMIYLTGKDNVALADIGYSMTYIGIILVFYSTIRNYLVARLSKNKSDFIQSYITNLKSLFKYAFAFFLVLSFGLSSLVALLKPHYLTFNTVIFSFIFFMATFINAYIGLFTVLSKTYDFNKMELSLNIMRFILIVAITNFIVSRNILLGVILINIVMILIEYLFAAIILKRIKYEPIEVI